MRWMIFGALMLGAAAPASAQLSTADVATGSAAPSATSAVGEATSSVLASVLAGGAPDAPASAGGTRTITQGHSDAARTLAGVFPADQRAAMEQKFEQLLGGFAKLEQSLGLPVGDLANATAMYVIASYEAAKDVTVDPSRYRPIIEKLREGYAHSAAFAQTSASDRRKMYEQLAMVGMLVAVSRAELAKHPNAETSRNLRTTARGYLAQFKLDPDTLALDGSPPPRAQAAAAPPAPAKPAYAYLAAPGKGIASKIEAIAYSWQQIYTVGGLQMNEKTYLLLKDGRVRFGLPPVGPDQFDAAAEQHGDPGSWGHWKKQGDHYAVKFGNDSYEVPVNEIVYLPGNPDEALDGTFKAASSYSIGMTASWSFREISFSRDHRFSRSHSGGAGGSTGFGDAQIVAGTSYNDTGSSSSVSGANFGGGSTHRNNSTTADREGTYKIRGYTLELHYDNGAVENRFFFTNANRTTVWFNGETLLREKH